MSRSNRVFISIVIIGLFSLLFRERSCNQEEYYGRCLNCCFVKNLDRNLTVECMTNCFVLPAEMAPYDISKVLHCKGIKDWSKCYDCCYKGLGSVGGPSNTNCTTQTCQL
jgi:hypothetical protein